MALDFLSDECSFCGHLRAAHINAEGECEECECIRFEEPIEEEENIYNDLDKDVLEGVVICLKLILLATEKEDINSYKKALRTAVASIATFLELDLDDIERIVKEKEYRDEFERLLSL